MKKEFSQAYMNKTCININISLKLIIIKLKYCIKNRGKNFKGMKS